MPRTAIQFQMPFGQIPPCIHQISVFVFLPQRKLPWFLHAKICSLYSLDSKCTGCHFPFETKICLILTDKHWNLMKNYFHRNLQYFSFYSEYFQNIILCSEYCISYICIPDCTFGVVGCAFPFCTKLRSLRYIKCFSTPWVSSVSTSQSTVCA